MAKNQVETTPPPDLSWDAIFHHNAQKTILERSVASGKVHHAILFTGQAGIGKRQVARAFAKALNCLERPPKTWQPACGRCLSCNHFERNIQPDFQEISPDGRFIKIDQIRELIKFCRMSPFNASYRIALIDSTDMMNRESANALLKTLEEPSDNILLMLLTDRPDALLDTILSRCQILRFGSLTTEEVVRIISPILAKKSPPVPPATIEVAARLSSGSPGDSLKIIESNILNERIKIFDTLMNLRPNATISRFKLADTLSKSGRDGCIPLFELMHSLFRDISIFGASKNANRLIHIDFLEQIESISNRMPPLQAIQCAEKTNTALSMLNKNVNPKLVAEDLLAYVVNQMGNKNER